MRCERRPTCLCRRTLVSSYHRAAERLSVRGLQVLESTGRAVERLPSSPSSIPQALRLRVLQQALHRVPEAANVAGGDEQAGLSILDDLLEPPETGRDDRHAGREGFKDDARLPLVTHRWHD